MAADDLQRNAGEDPESVWLRETYQPNATNLTVRAVLGGAVIGVVMCLSNIYVFFKTGWSLGVTITAAILAFAVFGIVARKKPLGMLENNALTTVASGAGYMTGGGNMAAFGALLMVTSLRPNVAPMIVWFAAIAALGVFAAIPIKRQLINQEALPFPTGTATAETLRTIHSGGDSRAVKWLGLSALGAAAISVVRNLKFIEETYALPFSISGHSLKAWGLSFKTELVYLGAGALMSFRTGWSLLIGSIFTYGILAPWLLEQKLISGTSLKQIVGWTVWPGASLLVAAGLTSFLLDYKSLGRAFTGISKIFNRSKRVETGIAAVESPDWWFPAGFAVLAPLVIVLMWLLFDIPVWAAVLAVPLAVIMGFIAARVTGETDVTPTKALGPLTQMMYGGVTPGNLSGNIMSANVTGGIGLHAADLLTTLKTGWLLGAKPRHQLYAQLFGVVVGAIAIVPLFNLVIPDPKMLGTPEWEAPSCLVWAGVSEAFAGGIDKLGHEARIAIVIAAVLGVVLALAEKLAPKHVKAWIPSPYGLGLAFVLSGSSSIMMFIGAAAAELFRRRQQVAGIVPVASGLIAGESLMGVVFAMLKSAGIVAK
ncbi:MAG: OPT/YSL family transporter [Kofleriaceae bacterium]|nr:OPT/YSL family transporter [Kofleriaceae bacterium]